MTADWTGTLAGLDIGDATPYKIQAVTGWFDYTAAPFGGAQVGSGTAPAPKPYANGSWPVPYWAPERQVTIALEVVQHGTTTFAQAVDALAAATVPDGLQKGLTLQIGGVSSSVQGSIVSRSIPTDLAFQAGLGIATIGLECTDPRRLGAQLSAGPTPMPNTTPLVTPSLTNLGNVPGPLTVTLTGPLTAPAVKLSGTTVGAVVAFRSGYTLAAGKTLVIDMEARSALVDGASLANQIATRSWFGLPVGPSTLTLTASAVGAGASIAVAGQSAWI
jgi:hypothetical protein